MCVAAHMYVNVGRAHVLGYECMHACNCMSIGCGVAYTLRERGAGGGMREEDGERERRGGADLRQARGAGARRMRGLWLQHWMSLRPTFHMNLSVHITFHMYPRVDWRGLKIGGGNLLPQKGVFCIFRFQSI